MTKPLLCCRWCLYGDDSQPPQPPADQDAVPYVCDVCKTRIADYAPRATLRALGMEGNSR